MPVAKKIAEAVHHSSWIREMFEEGARLAAVHGSDRVFDFSIGNPSVEPPKEFQRVLEELVRDPRRGLRIHVNAATRRRGRPWPLSGPGAGGAVTGMTWSRPAAREARSA